MFGFLPPLYFRLHFTVRDIGSDVDRREMADAVE
jgi:hypothetical protein